MSRDPKAELLARAAGCYQRAGLGSDAVRCYEAAGEFGTAGRLHEYAGRLADAARCFERGNDWRGAAECHRRRGDPAAAADCLVRADDPLYAAWVLAEEARQFVRARQLAEDARPVITPAVRPEQRGYPDTLMSRDEDGNQITRTARVRAEFDAVRDVVLARCDLGLHRPDPAARRLDAVIDRLPALGPAVNRQQAIDWALRLAELLERPDLASLIYAACYRAGMPGTVARWEAWAIRTLGDAFGIPVEDAERPREPPARESPNEISPDEFARTIELFAPDDPSDAPGA